MNATMPEYARFVGHPPANYTMSRNSNLTTSYTPELAYENDSNIQHTQRTMAAPPAFRGETTLTTIQTIDQRTVRIHELFQQVFDMYYDSKYAIVASERENSALQLRALSKTLQKDIAEQHEVAASLNVTDIAEVYVTAGYTKDEAVIKAKKDLAGLSERIRTIEGMIGRMAAEVVYGNSS